MSKFKKALLLLLVLTIVASLSACAVGVTCISHIDRDENGKCDNCGQTMEVNKSNVNTLKIKTEPTKLYYAMNETLDLSGGVLSVTYNDGTPDAELSFTAEGVTVAAPGMGSAGQKLVAISYGGKTVTYSIEVGAARFTVSFDLGYPEGEEIAQQTVTINEHATAPEDPIRSGYDFINWYTSNKFDTVFDFEMIGIAKDTTIYAKWVQKFTVTYDANYDDGADQEFETVKGKAKSDVVPAKRTGYTFGGWYTTAACEEPFSFDSDITKNTTIFAYWVSDTVEMHTVTFNHNYGTEPTTSTVSVPDGSPVATPTAPSRQNVSTKGHQVSDFAFGGWYTDPDCKTAYVFTTAVRNDLVLYAKGTGNYIFEAEHVSLTDPVTGRPLQGMGASGGSEGPNMVDSPAPGMEGINASNGYYVTYLYAPELALNFVINSDRDVSDATLVFRISIENSPIALTPSAEGGETWGGTRLSQYIISLNNKPIDYDVIEITDAQGHEASGGRRPFSDFTLAVNLPLQKGSNVFNFMTANNNGMGGTMSATAPVIDCIKISTSANLSWNPLTDNEFGQ